MLIFILLGFICHLSSCDDKEISFKLVTVATEQTDGFKRFMRSANVFGLDVEVYGLNEKWEGGDLENGPGGGQKINILKEALRKYKNNEDLVLMFTDSYDVVINAGSDEILKRFLKTEAKILISAEDYCWPDKSLAVKYPKVNVGYKYLCSGGIIGYANKVYEVLSAKPVNHTDDDQLYYTQIYLEHREKYNIKLDNKAELFQNLNGNQDDVELRFDGDNHLWNKRFGTYPIVIHGNGPSKDYLSHLGNYLGDYWTYADGCKSCKENTFLLQDVEVTNWPKVLIGLFIPAPTPFVTSYLEHISNLEYPKEKIDIFIHSVDPHHDPHVEDWLKRFETKYLSVTYKRPTAFLTEKETRHLAFEHCKHVKCDYYLSVDSIVTLSNTKTLQMLIEQNRTFISPMISKPGKLFSNFWGKVGQDGFYERSPDYIDIVKYNRRGVWNVPFVSNVYLIQSDTLKKFKSNPFNSDELDQEMSFCSNARKLGMFMYITNLDYFGHIKEDESYTTHHKHNDLYQIFDNRIDWEDRYLHPEMMSYLNPTSTPNMPCPDVYWFPLTTKNFTKELVEVMEKFVKWSGGGNKDDRISGGYENVPTVDIHMNQVGLEKQWLKILKDYIAPMSSRYFTGYNSDARAIMNFVVKYTTNGQYYLRPHHDSSTYTINMALNNVNEYEGGGARFTRYNCSVAKTKEGWALMHPGRLTHQHEGLPILKGTRYIMVSFVDP
ncbi:procollagen-lysine,2-oxoglutarate 5-dioxygenase 1 isoform X1 [Hydra vulgaris]|uniref:procollagen-lysine,2-oxoglutarate 5-dioxygenase 1 isoform X1 n=1 Tax=Hydra vulgaris TaxID=6087 RepID=UPI0032EA011E